MTPQQRLRIGAAQPWLPASAFDSGLAEVSLLPAVDAWAGAWFGAAKLAITGSLRPWTGQSRDWKSCGDGVALGCASDERLALADRLMGAKAQDPSRTNPADRKLADDLAWRCAASLGEGVATVAGLMRKQVWKPADEIDLSDMLCAPVGPRQGDAWLRIAIDRALLVRLIRDAAPADRTPSPLASLDAGIETQAVTVSALLGRCDVTLGDLASLERGDVLCLDGCTDEPVALAIEYAAGTATCRIEQESGALRLRITE